MVVVNIVFVVMVFVCCFDGILYNFVEWCEFEDFVVGMNVLLYVMIEVVG